MATLPPSFDRRALLLASVLKSGDGSSGYEGAYDPIANERHILLGENRGSAIARMVSWHETFHAFLNGSTCHGNTMIFSGALASAGFEGFTSFVQRLIECSLRTHETYATVASVSAAGRGVIETDLLTEYPAYQPFLRSFTDLFPSTTRPLLALMALTSCARAAMQTSVYKELLARTCDAWPDIDLDPIGAPDKRFARLLAPAPVEAAITAMNAILNDAGAPYREIAAGDIAVARELQIWGQADEAVINAVSTAAFTAFADQLGQRPAAASGYDDQKNDLSVLIAKVEAYAGARLKTRFQRPITPGDDEVSVLTDFRREQLILSEEPLPAIVASTATYEEGAADLFVLGTDARRYVQLVAMPLAKARALYAPLDGGELLESAQDEVIACLRRRWAPEGEASHVELLLLRSDEADSVLARLDASIFAVCALSVLQANNWIRKWLLSEHAPIQRLVILIDADPFALIDLHGDRGGELHLTYLRALSDPEGEAHTEIVCFAAANEPAAIYFTPCTTPFRQALIEYACRRFPRASVDTAFLKPWLPMLKTLSVHTLREERRFGDRFWV